jgi:hypothetical protein
MEFVPNQIPPPSKYRFLWNDSEMRLFRYNGSFGSMYTTRIGSSEIPRVIVISVPCVALNLISNTCLIVSILTDSFYFPIYTLSMVCICLNLRMKDWLSNSALLNSGVNEKPK